MEQDGNHSLQFYSNSKILNSLFFQKVALVDPCR